MLKPHPTEKKDRTLQLIREKRDELERRLRTQATRPPRTNSLLRMHVRNGDNKAEPPLNK